MQIKSWAIGILSLMSVGYVARFMIIPNEQKLSIVLLMPPKSTDPIDYDYSIHHNTMRSIFASLVSEYSNGKIEPQIAKKWKSNSDKTVWTVEIDKKWTFDNGDYVTTEIVLKNFKRILIIKNHTQSNSGLLEHLIDAKKMLSFNDEIVGLQRNQDEITFRFTKPMPDFLEKISFGIYSIAHPSDYYDDTKWKNNKKAIASGFYKISSWTKDTFSLELRKNLFPDKLTNKNIQKVDFFFPEDLSNVGESQIIFSDRISSKLDESKWSFASSALDNKIIYIQVMNWNKKDSIFLNKETRQMLRGIFYKNLEQAGMMAMTSFFPLSIKGVKKFSFNQNKNINVERILIPTQPFTTTNYKVENRKKSQGDIFAEAYYGFCRDINAIAKINEYPEKAEDEKKVFELQYLGTGISIDSPKEDIRFMFNSKHGIMLPDATGKILKLLDSDFDIQQINEELWDQAIIWPIRHYSSGFWYRKDSNLDLTELNLLLTPIDLQFLKWN